MSAFVAVKHILSPSKEFLVIFLSLLFNNVTNLLFLFFISGINLAFRSLLINSSLKPASISPFLISKRFYAEKEVFQRTKPHCNIGKEFLAMNLN